MTEYWRRQTVAGGNFPAIPTPRPAVPFWPQTLPPATVVGRMPGTAGATQAIPFAYLLASLTASLSVQIETAAGTINVLADTQLLVINKASASATPINLPSVAGRNKVQLEIYDWTGLGGDMVLTPNGAELINGLSSWTVGSGGVAGSGGSLKLIPLTDLDGWLVR